MASSIRKALLPIVGLAALHTGFLAAQQTAADSAAVLLQAARSLEHEGSGELARELLRFLRGRYPGTPAGTTADSLLRAMPRATTNGAGRTGFILYHTAYGGFLGVAIPAAAGADDPAPFGAGLLLGAPLGYFGSRAFARAHLHSAGQSGVASFATLWGTWQGLGWQQTFNLGDREICLEFGCYIDTSDRAPWTAMVIGGLAGLGTGLALAATREIRPGTSTLISSSALWGTWYGVALGKVLDLEGDDLFAATMVAGNLAFLGAIPAAHAWRPSSSRVRLISAGGLAGGLAGVGIDLLADVNEDRTALAIPAATSALGLLAGALATRGRRDLDDESGEEGPGAALLLVGGRARLGVPLPVPSATLAEDRWGRLRWWPGARLTLLDARF